MQIRARFSSGVKGNNGTDFDVAVTVGDKESSLKGVHITKSGLNNVRNACFAIMCANLLNADADKALEALALND